MTVDLQAKTIDGKQYSDGDILIMETPEETREFLLVTNDSDMLVDLDSNRIVSAEDYFQYLINETSLVCIMKNNKNIREQLHLS
ncbi:hypothetical protein ACPWSR_15990 [Alloiococcus sp. CFN-8]|uniref:hypothetical protein n=1 Tax=Alloiococcus sp. CFN-8 TaxID=3416081 RepID=UPI003CF5439B